MEVDSVGAGPIAGSSKGTTTKIPLRLTSDTISRLRPAKIFKDCLDTRVQWTSNAFEGYSASPQIISIAFDDSGETFVTVGEDEAFTFWSATKGLKQRHFLSRKYGISLVRFTHSKTNVIHTSTKGNHDIRYHSSHDNKYLAYFRGHTARVRSLHMHPTEDLFISGGDDGTVRLWDLRTGVCRGLLNSVGGSTIAAFDNTGSVFAVACSDRQYVMLYGTHAPDAPPFCSSEIIDFELAKISQPPRLPIFTSISFSNNGSHIFLATSSSCHYILDAFDLRIKRRLMGHMGLEMDSTHAQSMEPRRGGSAEEAGLTSDSGWAYSGSSDGSVCFWDISQVEVTDPNNPQLAKPPPTTLQPTTRLHRGSLGEGQSRTASFNPRYGMLAVGGNDITLWLPSKDPKTDDGW